MSVCLRKKKQHFVIKYRNIDNELEHTQFENNNKTNWPLRFFFLLWKVLKEKTFENKLKASLMISFEWIRWSVKG